MGAAFSPDVWRQLKNLTAGELCRALEREGWTRDTRGGSMHIYRRAVGADVRRVSIHVHAQKTYGAGLLKGLLEDIGWTVDDLRRMKLIK
ncbi:MAG TPA: type II toxin-antitoxin system HicA family toxin [Vicinamibacterales bacterium]|nr:type II toxin-antitoxin system HicA family toxin [Vicinamibacterales bacterium]